MWAVVNASDWLDMVFLALSGYWWGKMAVCGWRGGFYLVVGSALRMGVVVGDSGWLCVTVGGYLRWCVLELCV
jgi:hypothetical protein